MWRRFVQMKFRRWLIRQLYRSGRWVVCKKETKHGTFFTLADLQHHMEFDTYLVVQQLANEWLLV